LGDVDFKIFNQAQGKNGYENLSFNEIINLKNKNKKSILQLVANVNGWFYRIKYKKTIKDALLKEENEFYENYTKTFSPILQVFLDIKKFYNKSFDSNLWKDFYTEKDYKTNYENEDNYRRSFNTKILLGFTEDKKEFFYSGFLNIQNQKNGKGVLITKEVKYEGNWLNDELHGWSLITNSEGFIYEGDIFL